MTPYVDSLQHFQSFEGDHSDTEGREERNKMGFTVVRVSRIVSLVEFSFYLFQIIFTKFGNRCLLLLLVR